MDPLNVLVVEDDAMIAELLAEVIADLGHVVCGIEATEEGAVAAAARCKPDLMIVDAQLGLGSGVDAVETITRGAPFRISSSVAMSARSWRSGRTPSSCRNPMRRRLWSGRCNPRWRRPISDGFKRTRDKGMPRGTRVESARAIAHRVLRRRQRQPRPGARQSRFAGSRSF